MVRGITTDSPTCPTWYSGIGQTGGMVGPGGTWDSRGQSHLSYMVQWGMVDPGRTVDSHGQSMVQWDSHVCRMDSDGKLGHE